VNILRIAVVLLMAATPLLADFNDGLVAYRKQDYATALRQWRPLAEQGNADAQYRVARLYHRGLGVARDDARAAAWYLEAARRGHAKQAVRWYTKAAEQGRAVAQANLAGMYAEARGVERDLGVAARWYRKAAEQGNAEAQYRLGTMFDHGRGVAENPGEAFGLYKKAAKQGHVAAQNSVGLMYELGRGVRENDEKAARWYQAAADQGSADARRSLDGMRPVAARPPAAAAVPAAAAQPGPLEPTATPALQEDAETLYRRGLAHTTGHGAAVDDAEAMAWFLEAAEQGHVMSWYRLGFLYLEGRGPGRAKDYVEAHKWFSLCAADEFGDAAAWKAKIARKMSEQELAESARRVSEWTAGR